MPRLPLPPPDRRARTEAALASVDASPSSAQWPPEWAFVVQLQAGTRFAASFLCGRIEHVTTGHAALFESLEEARAFMEGQMTPK